ncbi:C40 family peptidase [Luteimonas sp. MC1572]|uniref:C40 family peptidase n=1 Tax=Luteimonas sp. MC1572 TaxID=2799325 RepID=UPI001F27B213|nr:C40 family peptidase [Luteimonas sp. MC1572]
MTKPANTHFEPRRALRAYRLLFSGLLLAAAAPAFSAPMLSADSADQQRMPSTSQALAGTDILAERAMLSAADVNMLIEASDALAGGEPAAQGRVQTLLQRAMTLLGTPYRWGGTSPDSGFDCSGLVGYVFRTALGIELPRVSREMAGNGQKVERAALAAGDLVFFGRRGKRVDHVGIYMGNGRFVHAPRTGRDVTVSNLDDGYWAGKFLQARRVEGLNG